jgi:hypothetical protein
MAHNAVQIERLHLRIPGLSREEAQRTGEEVAARVARSLPAYGEKQRLGALDMRVKLPLGTPRDQIAKLIALSILEKLT